MLGRRLALIVATDRYDHGPQLRRCVQDAKDLEAVLADPEIGDFETRSLHNISSEHAVESLQTFLSGKDADDQLLLYFAGHMLMSSDSDLQILTSDTDVRSDKPVRAISGFWLTRQLVRCRSRRVSVILDGCGSGTFVPDQSKLLAGPGRAVLAASTAAGPAFESEHHEIGSFTDALTRGLKSHDADIDGDGVVSIYELFEYVHDIVKDAFDGAQIPSLSMIGGSPASFIIARYPTAHGSGLRDLANLPSPVLIALRSPLATERQGGVLMLAGLIQSDDLKVQCASLFALTELLSDEVDNIAKLAENVLRKHLPPAIGSGRIPAPGADWSAALDASRVVINLPNGDFNLVAPHGDAKGFVVGGKKNKASSTEYNWSIKDPASIDEFQAALKELAARADESLNWEEKAEVLPALKWWLDNSAKSDKPVDAEEQTSRLRQSGGWVWKRFTELLQAMPAAAIAAWAFEVVHGIGGSMA